MMICTPLALIFGAIGIFLDSPRWLAVVVALIAMLLMAPFLAGIILQC